MKSVERFNSNISDSQATSVEPVSTEAFDYEAYADYVEGKSEKIRTFRNEKSAVIVYRRMRSAKVFSAGCRDRKDSLELQLGALQFSMKFEADVPNYIEPWYGIGTVASAFGLDYIWDGNLAPAVNRKFSSAREILTYESVPIAETDIGKKTLLFIEYILNKTRGKIPVSFCDIQSPLNIAANIIDSKSFMTDFYLDPEAIHSLLARITDLLIDFTRIQLNLIGSSLARPGHGFASSTLLEGFGMSDDTIVMLPDDLYSEFAQPYFEKVGNEFGGPAFHSCGNWENKIDLIKRIRNLRMVDGAFSKETDPDPNQPEVFSQNFANTDIIVNARIVGDLERIEDKVKKLWRPGMKLIVVTYCNTEKMQAKAYKLIHSICQT